MAAFAPLFDVSTVRLQSERLITLPDRYRSQPAPTRIARYESATLWLMELRAASAGSFDLRWPAAGTARVVDISPSDSAALGVDALIEFSVLPFSIATTLRALPGGAPTFYLGATGTPPDDNALLQPGDPPRSVAQLWLGVVFQDRQVRASWAWVDAIGDALAAASPADAAAWRAMSALFDATRAIQVLDAQGQPLPNASFDVAFVNASNTVIGTSTVTADVNGRLDASALPPAGVRLRLKARNIALPLLVHQEGALDDSTTPAVPAEDGTASPLELPTGLTRAHVQVADVDAWLAPITPARPADRMRPARFRSRSHLEPLVDGHAVYQRLVPDMRAANVAGGGVYLMGWAILNFELIPGDPDSTIVKLLDAIRERGDARVMATRMFQPKPGTMDTISTDTAFLIALLHMIGPMLMSTGKFDSGWGGRLFYSAAIIAAVIVLITLMEPGGRIEDTLRDKIEPTSEDTLDQINHLSRVAYRSPHPASVHDNPLFEDVLLPDGHHLTDFEEHFSVYHNKVQLVRKAPSGADQQAADGFGYVAYIGGIDINTNRLDAPGHHGAAYREPTSTAAPHASPFHDVHARVTGESVVDVFGVFEDRYGYDAQTASNNVPAGLPFTTPAPANFAAFPVRHLVQVTQTEFKPSDPQRAFGWAPEGNRTNAETYLRAIQAAREYIYVEDQYLVPDDRYIHALVNASQHCKRLVVLALSAINDIPFGEDRRLAMFERLAAPEAWGDRVLIGSPHRRPLLDPAERAASMGRLTLMADITAGDTQILVAPPARVPEDARFFLWINGEMMFAMRSNNVTDADSNPAARLDVLRGGVGTEPRWCPNIRAHAKGSPVTAAHPLGIYLHAKTMMVDDVFVGVGSMNLNRRGFYQDGEVVASAIPAKLAATRDNPARKLRTALWAEHLGIDPAMGGALLSDPIAAFELFRRSRYQGSRFTPFREFLVPHADTQVPKVLENIVGTPIYIALEVAVQSFLQGNRTRLWNDVADPTSGVDPNPVPGPEIH
jgi:phosphatidylserine/phosphatidylglycerophosphate/cardiolipin synthase-like enzyme